MRLRTALVTAMALAGGGAAFAQVTGPSSSTSPYIVPSASLPPGAVRTVSILSAGDAVGGYRLVGVPDGLGAWTEDDGTVTLLMNHELPPTEGIVRAHGSAGSFVSRYSIDPLTLAVLSGRDHSTSPADVHTFDKTALRWNAGTTAWERFCSADLAAQSAFHFGAYGTARRIFLDGEETRPTATPDFGRAFAHVASGPGRNESWELPSLGRVSWENAVANPYPQIKTIVMGMDDGDVDTTGLAAAPSEVYMYVGTKKKDGSDIEKAGLTGGVLYGIQVSVDGVAVGGESDDFALGTTSFVGSGRFAAVPLGDVTARSGIQLQADAKAAGSTRFQRTEDGSWDPRPGYQNDYYFVTTASPTTNSRLWRLRFDDITNPEFGGTIEVLLNGTEGHRMFDNITVDPLGRIILLEDVGNNARLGRVWMYDTTNRNFVEIAIHDASRFAVGGASFLTQDEETSGVIQAFDLLGAGWYLLDDQAHYAFGDPEIVEGGQLLALYVDPALGR